VGSPNNLIAPQWRDLELSSLGRLRGHRGHRAQPPLGRAVGRRPNYYGLLGNLNFEVILHEGSGVIDLAYGAMSGAGNATIGLENPTGTEAVGHCPSGNSCTAISNSRVRFTPIP
jgi:hypothetical protein